MFVMLYDLLIAKSRGLDSSWEADCNKTNYVESISQFFHL